MHVRIFSNSKHGMTRGIAHSTYTQHNTHTDIDVAFIHCTQRIHIRSICRECHRPCGDAYQPLYFVVDNDDVGGVAAIIIIIFTVAVVIKTTLYIQTLEHYVINI